MKKIVTLVLSVGLMEPYNPEKTTDLGSIMIGIIDYDIKAQYYRASEDKAEQLKAGKCIKRVIEGFQHCTKEPASSFRTETMSLYLNILIGMQAIGLDIIQ